MKLHIERHRQVLQKKKYFFLTAMFITAFFSIPLGSEAQGVAQPSQQNELASITAQISTLRDLVNTLVNLIGIKTQTAAQSADITSSLIGHWAFDEGGGTVASDSSGASNAGVLVNGPVWTTGKIGGALMFDGTDDYVRAPTQSLTQAFTIAFWMKPTSAASERGVASMSDAFGSGVTGRNIDMVWLGTGSDHGPRFRIWDGSAKTVRATTKAITNTWQHVAAVHTGTEIMLFVNGVEEARSVAGSAQYISAPFYFIGYSKSVSPNFFSGALDDIRIYGRALTSADIQALFALGSGGSSPDTTPPTTPTNLAADPVSSSEINLSWTASTDNVGVTGYRLERCTGSSCTNFTQIAAPIGITFNNTGLAANTTYRYRVRAVDATGNLSGYSEAVGAQTAAGSTGSSLATIAAGLSPGAWAQLTTLNPIALLKPSNGGDILEFANRGAWDAASSKLYYCGASHHGSFLGECVVYSENTNQWSTIAKPVSDASIVHGYDHNALDTTRGNFYFRQYNSVNVWRYNTGPNTWTLLPTIPLGGSACVAAAAALEYFPDIDRLVYFNSRCGGGAYLYNPGTNSWTSLAPLNIVEGEIHNMAAYLPLHGLIIFGGGNNAENALYKLNTGLSVTRIANPPANARISESLMVADPVSGNLLLLSSNGFIYEYDPQTGSWAQKGSSQISAGFSSIVSPIANHNVIMLVKSTGSASNIEAWLYKNTSGGSLPPPDTTPPTTPTNLAADPVSSSEINLSWTASTDNVGVTGYRLERCTGSSCTNFTQIATSIGITFNNTGLAANTTYRYRVRAVDATGNLSGYSGAVGAQTVSATPPPGGDNFAARCSGSSVVRCYTFDNAADIASRMLAPSDGSAKCTGGQCWFADTTTKASGAASLRFELPARSGSDTSGSFRMNFTDNFSEQFGAGETFYVQWRQRFTPEMLIVFKRSDGSATGWKQAIIGEGDQSGLPKTTSCTELELVFQQDSRYMGPSFYHSCGRFISLDYWDGTQVRLQHQGPPFCYYPDDPQGGCFPYIANEWMTFKMRVDVGQWNTPSSRVRVWAAREGAPSVAIYDTINSHSGGFTLYSNPGSGSGTNPGAKYGKIWLLPYTTARNPNATYQLAYTWYDELIISRSDIPDPGATAFPPPTTLQGDLNNDGTVNTLDWSLMNAVWFTNDVTADLNSDGLVNSIDYGPLNRNWGRTL